MMEETVDKKFLLSVVVIFVLSMIMGFVVHGFLLEPDYAQLPNLMRTKEDAANYFAYMLIAHVFMAVGFVWIYNRGKENKPFLAQGLRYGAAVAVLTVIPMYLIYYAVSPYPEMVVVKQIVFDTCGRLVLGVVVAWMNK